MPESFSFSDGTSSESGETSYGPRARELVKSQDFSAKPTKNLGDPDVAQRVRDVIKDIARQVVEEETSDSRVGRVISIDFAAKTANVWFPGDERPIKVNLFSSTLPGSWQNQLPPGATSQSNSLVGYGSIVMVETINGKPYITEVLTGGQFSIDWEAAGNIERVYDSSGNPSESGVASYTYKVDWATNVAEVGNTVALFHDSFSRTLSQGWGKAESGQQYFIDLGDLNSVLVSSGTGIHLLNAADSPVQVIAPVSRADDVISQWDVLAPPRAQGAPISAGHLVRHLNADNFYNFELRFNPDGSVTAAVSKMVNGVFADIQTYTLQETYEEGDRFRAKAECIGTTLRMKAWKVVAPLSPIPPGSGGPGSDPGDPWEPPNYILEESWARSRGDWVQLFGFSSREFSLGWGTAPNGMQWQRVSSSGAGGDYISRSDSSSTYYRGALYLPGVSSINMAMDVGVSNYRLYCSGIFPVMVGHWEGLSEPFPPVGFVEKRELRILTRYVDNANYYALCHVTEAIYRGGPQHNIEYPPYTMRFIKVVDGQEIDLVPPTNGYGRFTVIIQHIGNQIHVHVGSTTYITDAWTFNLIDNSFLSATRIGFSASQPSVFDSENSVAVGIAGLTITEVIPE